MAETQPTSPGSPAEFSANPALTQMAENSASIANDLVAGTIGKMFQQQQQPQPQAVAPQQPITLPQQPAPQQPAPQQPAQSIFAPPQAVKLEAPIAPPQPPPPPPPPQPQSISDRYAAPDPDAKPVVPTLPEVPPEQNIVAPQNMSENAAHAFAASRAETRRYRELAEQYRKQVEEVRQNYETYSQRENALAEKLTAEQNRTKELEEEIGKMDLERSPSFRQQYDSPLQSVRDDLVRILTDNGIQGNDAMDLAQDIMVAGRDDVPEMVRNLPTVVQGMIMVKHNEADNLWAQRNQALSDWRATQTGLDEVAAKDGVVMSAQRRAELANSAFDRISSVAPTMQWNDGDISVRRAAAIEKAKAWYQQAPEDQIAAAAMEGALAPFAYERISQLQNEVDALRVQLDGANRLRNPPISPYFQSVPVVAPPPPPKQTDPRTQQAWAPVDGMVDTSVVANSLVTNAMRKFM